MKRLLPLLLMLLFLAPALAEDEPVALFLEAHPGYEILCSDAQGDTAAGILAHEDERVLCVAQRQNGTWTLTIDNPHAMMLLGSAEYGLQVEDQDTLRWCWQNNGVQESYGAVWTDSAWQLLPMTYTYTWPEGSRETKFFWGDGYFCRTFTVAAADAHVLSAEERFPLPASWLNGMTTLETFDLHKIPTFLDRFYRTDVEEYAIEMAARELLPDYGYLGGSLFDSYLQLLMRKADGSRVFVGVTYDGGWRLTESTPLPDGTTYGWENFLSWLDLIDGRIVNIVPWADGTWGVGYIFADDELSLQKNCVADGPIAGAERVLVGDHPWSDITTIDWTTLPCSLDEARARVDSSGWAMVNNPHREDRLPLYAEPDGASRSLGEYCNGAFMRVLERGRTWTKVDLFGAQGWMATNRLAFGKEMEAVQRPQQLWAVIGDDNATAELFDAPDGELLRKFTGTAILLGVIGDTWYHVYLDETGAAGYVRQEDLIAGNG